ncbi:MAG: class I SAM-dependent methyltransferase [Caldilineaceae bacterium]
MSANSGTDFGQRRDRFRRYENAEAVQAYLLRLETEWPERATIATHIADQVIALQQPQPYVLELCCGPGRLAETLLATMPHLRYTGVDLSPPFLAFARQQLAAYANQAQLFEADLNDTTWPHLVAPHGTAGGFHAIVSLQSLHDVGDEAAVSRLYGLAKDLLLPGGFFLNADLVVAEGEELPNNPGRRSIARHLDLLHEHGYHNIACTLAIGGFGCVMGWR